MPDSHLPATPAQHKLMWVLWAKAGIRDREQRIMLTSTIIGREITSSRDLTITEGIGIIDRLESGDITELVKQCYSELLF